MVKEMTKMDRVVIDNMTQLSQNVSQMASTVADAFASIRARRLPQGQGPRVLFTPMECHSVLDQLHSQGQCIRPFVPLCTTVHN